MPDSFPESPYAKHPTIKGAALLTGHARYAGWFREVDHPKHAARVASYRAMTERLNGLEPGSATTRSAPEHFPPLMAQARNFAGAMVKVIRSGGKRVTPEVQAERWAACKVCPFVSGNRCKLCGCGLKAKTWLASMQCPDSPPRWLAVTGPTPGARP